MITIILTIILTLRWAKINLVDENIVIIDEGNENGDDALVNCNWFSIDGRLRSIVNGYPAFDYYDNPAIK